jgi:hypothetical protein
MSISDSGQYGLLDQLAEEFAARFRRGERPALKEYIDRYPHLAEEIRELFPAMVRVEQAKGARLGDETSEETGESRRTDPPLKQIGASHDAPRNPLGRYGSRGVAEYSTSEARMPGKTMPGSRASSGVRPLRIPPNCERHE